jgi:hypothetical protein
LQQSRIESPDKFVCVILQPVLEVGCCRIAKRTARCIAKKDPQGDFQTSYSSSKFHRKRQSPRQRSAAQDRAAMTFEERDFMQGIAIRAARSDEYDEVVRVWMDRMRYYRWKKGLNG